MPSLPLKILVLDTSPTQLLASAEGVQDGSIEVAPVSGLQAALDLVRDQDFALALLDLDLCNDGQLLRRLLASTGLRDVPVILLGSSPAQADGLEAAGAVLHDFLLKPVPAQRLHGRLRLWLELAARRLEFDERQQELQRLARLQSVMVDALSHDVRTPLSALTLNAELIARGSEAQNVRQAALRIKSALAMLGLQIDHLARVAAGGDTGLRPMLGPLDARALVQERVTALSTRVPAVLAWELTGEGDAQLQGDATLIADAVDGLLKLAAAHAAGGPVNVVVDGRSRRTLRLGIQFDQALPDAEQRRLFASPPAAQRQPPSSFDGAWDEAGSVVRAHGGSLIGRSRPREGTVFECLLPREAD